ncbi:integrase catalytic domain-containing protein [Trichonephila clavipes]|nr:integrase catalytic domain-containing protein [Trichonephila clavipes]
MAFLEKGSKVDLQYMATEIGVEVVLGMRVFELRDAILNSEYFDEEFCREFLNTILEERERKEEIELDERKRKEERELAERKRKEEMEVEERKRRADFEQKMTDVKMEFETQKKLIELEREDHFTRACLDIEVSIDRGNIGNEVRSNIINETRLKVEVKDRLKADEEAKAVEEGRKMEEEGKMNERIALEGEIRLKKEKWLVEEQIADQYAVTQSVVVEKEKEEISIDVIKDEGNLNPVILSKERIDFDEDEIEEEKPKLPKRKRKNLSRIAKCDTTGKTAACLQFRREIRTIDDVTNDFRALIDNENFDSEITPYLKILARISSEVSERIEEKQDQRKTFYDKRHHPGPLYHPGDKVWVTLQPLSNAAHKKTAKFMHKRDRPYINVTQRSPTTYEVANPNNPHEAL